MARAPSEPLLLPPSASSRPLPRPRSSGEQPAQLYAAASDHNLNINKVVLQALHVPLLQRCLRSSRLLRWPEHLLSLSCCSLRRVAGPYHALQSPQRWRCRLCFIKLAPQPRLLKPALLLKFSMRSVKQFTVMGTVRGIRNLLCLAFILQADFRSLSFSGCVEDALLNSPPAAAMN